MEQRRDIRRVALVILYQMDLSGETDPAAALRGLGDDILAENGVKPNPQMREGAAALAAAVWAKHEAYDALASQYAAAWPSRRQPAVDRALIRLAWHEIVSGHAPVTVAINEAVELAKAFGSDKSPAFVNAVLDKMTKEAGTLPPEAPAPARKSAKKAAKPSSDAWLDDAKNGAGKDAK